MTFEERDVFVAKLKAENLAIKEEKIQRKKAKAREATRRWAANNPERVKANAHKWYMANRERELETGREWRVANPEKMKEYQRRDKEKDPEKFATKHYKRLYGITYKERDLILAAQGKRCACCRTDTPGKHRWHVDHCHKTKKVRGILCHRCNLGIGLARDSVEILETWIAYLER
jgi:hypothetical protein